ncbi:hypothetical protein [Hoeflea sp. TYP-13]|uniref:hypothetical protein n=1 Tax=Hoeflea sp. TYP-13 TaxID=3230023 RepID=UPI0034C6D91C
MTIRSRQPIIIGTRFRGPPRSGNGGYTAGLLGRIFDRSAEVTLLAPPPLRLPLIVEKTGDDVTLWSSQKRIATAKPAPVDIQVPPAPTLVEANAASSKAIKVEDHLFPECFVCGPNRCEGDGLRIFSGLDVSEKFAAAVWQPSREFTDETGYIAPEIIWASLDCPSYFGLMKPGLIALLGQFAVEIFHRPVADQTCIISAWPIREAGTKHIAGSALYDASGRPLARARAVWIELQGATEDQKNT